MPSLSTPAPIHPSARPRRRVLERPDGFYWEDEGEQLGEVDEYGPFATLLEAMLDMQGADAAVDFARGETLEEAERELGMAGWIDPETGEPAEAGVPHRVEL